MPELIIIPQNIIELSTPYTEYTIFENDLFDTVCVQYVEICRKYHWKWNMRPCGKFLAWRTVLD